MNKKITIVIVIVFAAAFLFFLSYSTYKRSAELAPQSIELTYADVKVRIVSIDWDNSIMTADDNQRYYFIKNESFAKMRPFTAYFCYIQSNSASERKTFIHCDGE